MGRKYFTSFVGKQCLCYLVGMTLLLLGACSTDKPISEEDDGGAGRISLSIRWQNSSVRGMELLNPDGTLNCSDNGITRIYAKVCDTAGILLADSGPDGWDCQLHSGLITGVPPGTNLRLIIHGQDADGNLVFRGEQTGITVSVGQTTRVEEVEAYPFSPELLDPAHEATVTSGGFIFQWGAIPGAAKYRIAVSLNSDLGESVVDDTTTATTYTPVGLATGFIYYWRVAAIDAFGNAGEWSSSFSFTIEEGVNLPPVLKPIGNQTVGEGETLAFTVSANDPEGGSLTYSAGNLPTGAIFNSTTGQFVWTPGFYQGGRSYPNILFKVTDDGNPVLSDSENMTITVGESGVNHPPLLDQIGPKQVEENRELRYTISAVDPDYGDDKTLTYSAGNLPAGSSFDPETQTFSWKPGYEDAGSYQNVLFTVTDEGRPPMSDSEAVTITVGNVNRPPVLDEIGNKNTTENKELKIVVTASDPDGDDLIYTANSNESNPLPAGWAFGAELQTFSWIPGYEDEGNYQVTFMVTDNGIPNIAVSETIWIAVGDVNRSPVMDPIGNKFASEGVALSFTVTASDPDGNNLVYSADNLPTGASFDTAAQAFIWSPAYGSAGVYPNVRFTVTDDGVPAMSASETIAISVEDKNGPPELNLIGDKIVRETEELEFRISASDPDYDKLTYSAVSTELPEGWHFDARRKKFKWTPERNTSGDYRITFTVKDDGSPPLSDSETITITVVAAEDDD